MFEHKALTRENCTTLHPGDKLVLTDIKEYVTVLVREYKEGDICTLMRVSHSGFPNIHVCISIDRLPEQGTMWMYHFRFSLLLDDWWDIWGAH